MLTPSIGFCLIPLTDLGRLDAGGFEDRRHDINDMVELRADAPTSLMWPGHEIAMPCRVPPKCDATCLVHLNGVSNAHAHATAMCG